MNLSVGDLVYNKALCLIGIVVDIVNRSPWPNDCAPSFDFYEVLYEENKTNFSVLADLEAINVAR